MSNSIESSHARISTYRDSDGHEALADISSARNLGGCAMDIFLRHACEGAFYLCRRPEESGHGVHIIMAPSPRWEQDIRDAGYEIIQKIETGAHAP